MANDNRAREWLLHMANLVSEHEMKTFQVFLRDDVGKVLLGASPRPTHPSVGRLLNESETRNLIEQVFSLTTAGLKGHRVADKGSWRTDIPNNRVGPFGVHIGIVRNGPGRLIMSCTITLTQDEVARVQEMCKENHVKDVNELLDIARDRDYL